MAQLTITIPDAQIPRIQAAFGVATAEDARQLLIEYLKAGVRNYEITNDMQGLADDYQAAKDAYIPPVDLDAT